MTIKLPIKGLVSIKGDHFVTYDAEDTETPFALWRGETWIGSYQTRKQAVQELNYRTSLGSPEGLWD